MGKKKKEPNIDTKQNYLNDYQKYITTFKTFKISLKKIIKYPELIKPINEMVFRCNRIITHTYYFLKYYLVYLVENNREFPKIDSNFILTIMKTVSIGDGRGCKLKEDSQNLKSTIDDFYLNFYSKTLDKKEDIPSRVNLEQTLKYETISLLTGINNHIIANIYQLTNRFVNMMVDKKNVEDKINSLDISKKLKKEKINEFRKEIRQIKLDILDGTDKSDEKYSYILEKARELLPRFNKKNDLIKDVQKNTIKYLEPLIKMSIFSEKYMRSKQTKENKDDQINVMNILPLRRSIIPKYIDLDTDTLVLNLIKGNKKFYRSNGATWKLASEIWDKFFKTDKNIFKKKGYQFNYRISTDGVGFSILFMREDKFDPLKRVKVKSMSKPKGYRPEIYIDDIDDNEREILSKYEVIGIDPGQQDLIYATNGETKIETRENGQTRHKNTTFRYTNEQRKLESRSKKYKKYKEVDKKESKIGRKTVEEIESNLSNFSSKSCILKNFRSYLKEKNKVNYKLNDYYQKDMFRNFKWFTWMNRKRSEDNMLNRFDKKFGGPEKNIICIGDFEQKKTLKYREPTKGKSFRKLFKNRGYKVYLVDEFYLVYGFIYDKVNFIINKPHLD